MNMHIEFRNNSLVRPPGRLTITSLAMILLSASATLVPCSQVVHAEGRSATPFEAERVTVERRRWWLDQWAHSMQETCFINWMNVQFGSATWQLVMTVEQVNTIYLTWMMISETRFPLD